MKDTLNREFDVALVLEALKERGEVVAKVAYGDWSRAGDHSRLMTQHAIQMVQRSVTPRGDKNGADINLALDAIEMAFTRHHINAFAIVGGDSDFMALVEKLKQFDKQVFVIGGRAFTSNILQKNCTEFIAYENLLRSEGGRPRSRRGEATPRAATESHSLSEALPNIQRALQILADRGVAPQLGLLKSTLLQLDSTFSERDYGVGSFLEFMQKVERGGFANLRRTERGYLVELTDLPAESKRVPADGGAEADTAESAADQRAQSEPIEVFTPDPAAVELLRKALVLAAEKAPGRPLYLRHVRQGLRSLQQDFDERRYGYRGTLDLLHHGQREGVLKLQRDHRGVWRIYPVTGAPAPAEQAAEMPEVAPEIEPITVVETVDVASPVETPTSADSPPPLWAENATEPAAAAEPHTAQQAATPPERKTRRRAATSTSKPRKSRKKTGES